MTQLDFQSPDRICEWCKVSRAVVRVIGTYACAACALCRSDRIRAWFASLGLRRQA